MSNMFHAAGGNDANIGTLKIYADDIASMFESANGLSATINIYSNPSIYNKAFYGAARYDGAKITVNYSSTTTNIDNIIATKSYDSYVVKGVQLD